MEVYYITLSIMWFYWTSVITFYIPFIQHVYEHKATDDKC